MGPMNSAIDRYVDLRDRVDRRAGELLARHGRAITCRARCCDCCVDLTVFPVEYHAILADLRRAGVASLPIDPSAACGFLRDGLCVLYEARPLICRTHGLPLAFEDDRSPRRLRTASSCPRTFDGADPAAIGVGPADALEVEPMNAELFEINLTFARERADGEIDPTRRIPLRRLVEDLAAMSVRPSASRRGGDDHGSGRAPRGGAE